MKLDVTFQEENMELNADFGQVVSTGGGGGIGVEKDPTVPEWAKQPEKPEYTIREIKDSIGESVAGRTFTPFTVDEENDCAYIYEEPAEAAPTAEIMNDYGNIAIGEYAQASGCQTQAIGNFSKAEGWWTRADGQCAVASGLLTRASGHFSHAEGTRTQATINNAHAEGDMTIASGRQSHAEGAETVASGYCSHSEGYLTQATNYYSHAEGLGTIAAGRNQTAMGKYNVKDTSSLLIVGNGTKDTDRKNAYKLDASGNGWYAGTVEVAGVILRDSKGVKHTLKVDENGVLSLGSITEEVKAALVAAVIAALPTNNVRLADVELLADKWVGDQSPYHQVVSVPTVTSNTQVDLTPSAEQLAVFHNKDLAFVTENDDGVVTVYAIGQKPANDYIIQATLTEVKA